MTINKKTVEKYMASYTKGDVKGIESTLTDDVVWDLPGAFHWEGKKAFMKEATDGFAKFGLPDIVTTRLTEENDVVVAEGTVKAKGHDGNPDVMVFEFCDVFEMKGGKIKRLISYLMNVPAK
jgi:ketosteroid isomerase-like protein